MNNQIKSRQRIADHGEVFTSEKEINSMLDLVKQETERIDSRFLEPACGTGNFLTEVLKRKLAIVENRYKKSQLEFEKYAVLAVSSIYGIDLLEDNIVHARERLFDILEKQYKRLFKGECKEECKNSVSFILSKNVVQGDALTLKTVAEEPQHIIFSEWSLVQDSMIKRREFTFNELINTEVMSSSPLFIYHEGDPVTPTPVKDYPLIHFLEVNKHEND